MARIEMNVSSCFKVEIMCWLYKKDDIFGVQQDDFFYRPKFIEKSHT